MKIFKRIFGPTMVKVDPRMVFLLAEKNNEEEVQEEALKEINEEIRKTGFDGSNFGNLSKKNQKKILSLLPLTTDLLLTFLKEVKRKKPEE